MFDDLPRVASDPRILGGKPIIKGTRISVEFLLELFASGASHEQVLKAYPHLSSQDLTEAVEFASRVRARKHPTSGGPSA